MTYLIKQIPEDFIVDEIPLPQTLLPSGPYSYCKLKKTSLSTQQATEFLSSSLNIPLKNFSYAGLKDKHAITSQYLTVKTPKKISFAKANLSLEHLGFLEQPLTLGALKGNSFIITVRNITKKPSSLKQFPNLYGEQRFSTENPEIGKALIKKDFKNAVLLIQQSESFYLTLLNEHLDKNPNDFVTALKSLPPRILKIYVHSYSSLLWNQVAQAYLTSHPKSKNIPIPLLGFSTDLSAYEKDIQSLYTATMKKESITLRDFIIRQFPSLTPEGTDRLLFSEIKDLTISNMEEDDLNPGLKKVTLSFSLDKGCYATEAVKAIFGI